MGEITEGTSSMTNTFVSIKNIDKVIPIYAVSHNLNPSYTITWRSLDYRYGYYRPIV